MPQLITNNREAELNVVLSLEAVAGGTMKLIAQAGKRVSPLLEISPDGAVRLLVNIDPKLEFPLDGEGKLKVLNT